MIDNIKIKAELLCSGFKLNKYSEDVAKYFNPHKQKRTGFVGVHLKIGHFTINALMDKFYSNDAIFTNKSSFELVPENGKWWIYNKNKKLCDAELIRQPAWYNKYLRDSICMGDVFLSEGNSNLMGALPGACDYHIYDEPCFFCGLNQSGKVELTPKDFAQTVAAAYIENQNLTVTINGGNKIDTNNGMDRYIDYVKEINIVQKSLKASIPIQIECSPAENLEIIDELIDLGVGSFSINLELYDEKSRAEVCAMKGKIPRRLYEANWTKIVNRLGAFKVASVLIYGIDQKSSIVDGSRYLLDFGVFPNISPFRPMPGSRYQNKCAPDYKKFFDDSMKVASLSLKYGVNPIENLGCFTCGSCSVERDCMVYLTN